MQVTQEQRDHYVHSVLDGIREVTQEEMEIRQKRLQLQWLKPPFVVAVVAPEYAPLPYEQKDDTIQGFKSAVLRFFCKEGYPTYGITDSRNNVAVLISLHGKDVGESDIDSLFLEVHEKLSRKFGLDLFIGIGNIQRNAADIRFSHAEAYQMLGYKYQYGARGVISASNVVSYRHAAALSNTVAFDRVVGCFTDGNIGKLAVRLDEMIEEIRYKPNVSGTSIRRTLAELLIHILNIASDADQNVEEILSGRDPYRWILAQNNTPVIREWILEICSQLIQKRQTREEHIEKDIIRRAKVYIMENIGNAELTLQSVSAAVGLTAPYFSLIFSKETGEGVNAFVTRMRMEAAGRLLTTTELKVDLIAAQLGFSSASYFNQVFKKTCGITPTEYRKKFAES